MKSTYKTMGGTYQQNGNYLLLNLEVPECPKLGIWGERRRKYLREHQQALYTAMMLSDTLNTHLEEVDRTATEMYDHLTSQLAEQEGITEQLKATNQLEWVQQMNNIVFFSGFSDPLTCHTQILKKSIQSSFLL